MKSTITHSTSDEFQFPMKGLFTNYTHISARSRERQQKLKMFTRIAVVTRQVHKQSMLAHHKHSSLNSSRRNSNDGGGGDGGGGDSHFHLLFFIQLTLSRFH
jgi:uncharacterized membrane protein YgcG